MAGRKLIRICEVCGTSFEIFPSVLTHDAGKFCSQPCYRTSRTIPLATRFQRYVGPTTENGCILWIGCTNPDGYGLIGSGTKQGRNLLAHRVAYELVHGTIPDGQCALHRCDNPPCINVDHLFLGTTADNMADKVAKGRGTCGEKQRCAKLTADLVRMARARYAIGGVTIESLAGELGVSFNAARCAIKGITWKHVD